MLLPGACAMAGGRGGVVAEVQAPGVEAGASRGWAVPSDLRRALRVAGLRLGEPFP